MDDTEDWGSCAVCVGGYPLTNRNVEPHFRLLHPDEWAEVIGDLILEGLQ